MHAHSHIRTSLQCVHSCSQFWIAREGDVVVEFFYIKARRRHNDERKKEPSFAGIWEAKIHILSECVETWWLAVFMLGYVFSTPLGSIFSSSALRFCVCLLDFLSEAIDLPLFISHMRQTLHKQHLYTYKFRHFLDCYFYSFEGRHSLVHIYDSFFPIDISFLCMCAPFWRRRKKPALDFVHLFGYATYFILIYRKSSCTSSFRTRLKKCTHFAKESNCNDHYYILKWGPQYHHCIVGSLSLSLSLGRRCGYTKPIIAVVNS